MEDNSCSALAWLKFVHFLCSLEQMQQVLDCFERFHFINGHVTETVFLFERTPF